MGCMTLWRDHLGEPVLLWPFLSSPILLLVHFGADLFGANFTKIIFSFSNFSILLIYIFSSLFIFFFFFSKQSNSFCLFVINFFPLCIKKFKFKPTAVIFFSIIPVTDKINS